jgi:hypothetical protein
MQDDLSDARLNTEFEEWAVDYVKGMDSRGAYKSPYMQIAWAAWKASAKATTRSVASRPQQGENAELVKKLKSIANEYRIMGAQHYAFNQHKPSLDCDDRAKTLEDAASALPGNGIPDGWQLVPKEPTASMKVEFWNKAGRWVEEGHDRIDELWSAMLAAAPHPEQE